MKSPSCLAGLHLGVATSFARQCFLTYGNMLCKIGWIKIFYQNKAVLVNNLFQWLVFNPGKLPLFSRIRYWRLPHYSRGDRENSDGSLCPPETQASTQQRLESCFPTLTPHLQPLTIFTDHSPMGLACQLSCFPHVGQTVPNHSYLGRPLIGPGVSNLIRRKSISLT
jgi:hypothetical protein